MVKRNIVMLPPPEVANQAIAWSRKIAQNNATDFILDGKQFYPHVTLFQGEYPEKHIAVLEQKLTDIVRSISPFSVRAGVFSSLDGFIFLEMEKSDALVSLQKTVFAEAGSLGRGLSAVAGKVFIPHITITRLRHYDEEAKALALLKTVPIAFSVHSLHLANVGSDGSVNEVYREFPFQMI